MAFALTSFWAGGTQYSGPGPYRGIQHLQFGITAAATDVDLDIGDFSGQFWTDAIADADYGDLATQVLELLENITSQAAATLKVYTPELADRIQAASASGTAYALSLDSTTKLPVYAFDTAQGETAYTVFVDLQLNPNIQPQTCSNNIAWG